MSYILFFTGKEVWTKFWEELPHQLQTDGTDWEAWSLQKIYNSLFADVRREGEDLRRGFEEGLRRGDGGEGGGDLQDPLWDHLWDQVG